MTPFSIEHIEVWKALLQHVMGSSYTFIAPPNKKVGKAAEVVTNGRKAPPIEFETLRVTHKFTLIPYFVNPEREEGQALIPKKAYDFAVEQINTFGYEELKKKIEKGEFAVFASYEAEKLRDELESVTQRGTICFEGTSFKFVEEKESSSHDPSLSFGTVVQRPIDERPSVEDAFGTVVVKKRKKRSKLPEAPKVQKPNWFKSLFNYIFSKLWDFITFWKS